MTKRLTAAIDSIDAANALDPNSDIDDHGNPAPKELVYGQRMSKTLHEFAPRSSEHLQLAARAQHIERWTSPRSDFAEGRTGYKKWRANLSLFHAKRAAELTEAAGYEKSDCERVAYLVQKRGIKRDDESQILEDVICLVFLESYFENFANKYSDEKIIDILQKTWAKMSDDGHAAALKISYPPRLLDLIQRALA